MILWQLQSRHVGLYTDLQQALEGNSFHWCRLKTLVGDLQKVLKILEASHWALENFGVSGLECLCGFYDLHSLGTSIC